MKHIARKRFGQHFLTDSAVIDAIVDAIAPSAGDAMVEIGPGLAALTQPLVERLGHLTVIELDRDLAVRLRAHGQLEVIESDVLKVDFTALAERLCARTGNALAHASFGSELFVETQANFELGLINVERVISKAHQVFWSVISTQHCADCSMGMFEKSSAQRVTLTKAFDVIGCHEQLASIFNSATGQDKTVGRYLKVNTKIIFDVKFASRCDSVYFFKRESLTICPKVNGN